MEIIEREAFHSYIPQDVQNAIDTILSFCYTVNLENKVLNRRIAEILRLVGANEINAEIKSTHCGTVKQESSRLTEIINHSTTEGGAA